MPRQLSRPASHVYKRSCLCGAQTSVSMPNQSTGMSAGSRSNNHSVCHATVGPVRTNNAGMYVIKERLW